MIKNIVFLIIELTLYSRIASSRSQFYDIPSYYGHFSLQYFDAEQVRTGNLVFLEYHFAIDASYNNQTIFYAKENQHCIYQYDTVTGKSQLLLGQCGNSGNIVGSKKHALFNGVSSLAYFEVPSNQLKTKIQKQKFLLVKNESCDPNTKECLLIDSSTQILTMKNIRILNKIQLFEDQPQQERFLIIADKNNHCIKKYSFGKEQIEVIGGICGQSGFLDGPLGYNKLSYPKNIGISRSGVVYFFDSGNQYIRIIKQNLVFTLLLGACKELQASNRVVLGVALKQIICYESWLQSSKSQIAHYFDPLILTICSQQYSSC